ncbi:MAG: FAD-dependent oxidoreductase [Acidimicrobiales bacterium]
MNRIRAGVTVLYLQKVKNWEKLTKITAIDWLRKYAGDQVTDVIWQPLLIGKFDRYYDKVTMAWLWGRVKQRVDSRAPGEKAEKLGYFDGGFATLVGTLESKVRAGGGQVRLGTKVSSLRHNEATDMVEVTVDGGAPESFDRVLATVPSGILANLIEDRRDSAPEYFQQLESIDYLSAALLVFATEQEVSPFYWHNVNTPDAPFVVFLSLTALIGTESFGGKHVYYIGDYVPPEHRYMTATDDEMRDHWYAELAKMFPHFDRSKIVEDHVFKFNNSQHIVDIGFEKKLADHQTPCPGVLLANFSQIYPMDRGTNYAVKDGIDMSDRILAELKTRNAV